jgi:3-deoxy-D-manno-octulosonate 8-phosphate phosphatase (KDO 8-P phosphatase)
MENISGKAAKVRLVIFDVDGVLTTGNLIYRPNGSESKTFHAHDGVGLRMLLKTGIEVGVITGRTSDVVAKRMQDLGIEHVYQGCMDKVIPYEELKQKLQLNDEQIAYVGDDLPDLPLLRRAGLGITVVNAPPVMHEHAMMVTKTAGGHGAAREVCEMIMRAQGSYDAAIQSYLDR